jgi:cytidylate kinase
MKIPKILAVDGPAGSGKSTIASLVSKAVDWDYLNTGTLYRLIGWLAEQKQLPLSSDQKLGDLIKECEGDIEWRHGVFYYKGQDLSHELQREHIGGLASAVGKSQMVRALLLPIQRKLALHAEKGVVIDGRDIGTVVFPNADLKLFMIANLEARAQRRYKQLLEKKLTPLPNVEDLMREIKARDEQDSQRDFAPLQKADDAIDFDTSSMSIEECVQNIVIMLQPFL